MTSTEEYAALLNKSRQELNQANADAGNCYERQKRLIREARQAGLLPGQIERIVGHSIMNALSDSKPAKHADSPDGTRAKPEPPQYRPEGRRDRRRQYYRSLNS